jgi:flagellin
MSLNSVNTNVGAMIALESLNQTNSDLAATQKQISTGYRVADATDDGAAYAVAQSVRSTVGALTTANQQLGNVQGLLQTTNSGLTDISNTMASMRDVLISLGDQDTSGTERQQYTTQYQSLMSQLKGEIQDSGYNGKTLIGNIGGATGTYARVATVRNEMGATYGLTTFSGSALFGSINFGGILSYGKLTASGVTNVAATSATMGKITTGAFSVGAVAKDISAGGVFLRWMNKVGTALNTVGSETNYVNSQISYNSNKIDALNTGLGSLVDADLAKESAQLQALQIRQQLGTQALSLANQAPQTLLSLFK